MANVVVRRALAAGVGAIAVVLGLLTHASLLLALGLAVLVITAVVTTVDLLKRLRR